MNQTIKAECWIKVLSLVGNSGDDNRKILKYLGL